MNLSVIIPIYNTPQHLLEHCLASIQENLMEMDDVEVLMINDGSTAPHIAPLLSKRARQDSRFQYISKTNSGVSNTRNMVIDNTLVYHYVTFEESAIHKFSNHDFRVAKNLLPRLEEFVTIHSPNKTIFISAICSRTLQLIRSFKSLYFTHPQNTKSFGELKREMDDFLSTPVIRKYIRKMRLKDAKDKIELKNIILLKLHLYWIFLLTERRKRLKKTPHSN